MCPDRFFEEPREQSVVKSTIVSKYFWAWAKAIIPSAKRYGKNIAYVDLFSGPGTYQDGTESTPIQILRRAISEEDIRQMLIAVFNDKDSDNAIQLSKKIVTLEGTDKLKFMPMVFNEEVGQDITRIIRKIGDIPKLLFADPWGYKGISLDLIDSVLKDFGCDCIIFFNFNRINAGLDNPLVKEHIDVLFGKERADKLRIMVRDLAAEDRELAILEEFSKALKDLGGTFVLPFRFINESGYRTSHYLVFVSKHFRGYEIMRDIMAKESSSSVQGVPSFDFIPADRRYTTLSQFCLPLEELGEMLLEKYAGKKLSMKQVYENHSADKHYIEKNYRDALRKLEAEGKIITDPPANKRRRYRGEVSFAEDVNITFPGRS